MQVRANRALRSSTSSTASSSASNAATNAPGLGSYDDFIQKASETFTARPTACAAPEGQIVPKSNGANRDPLRERMLANDVSAASGKAAKQLKSVAKQAKVGGTAPPGAGGGKRSELLNYKQQAIQRERVKQLRKQSVIKIQSFVRGWLRLRSAQSSAALIDAESDQVRA